MTKKILIGAGILATVFIILVIIIPAFLGSTSKAQPPSNEEISSLLLEGQKEHYRMKSLNIISIKNVGVSRDESEYGGLQSKYEINVKYAVEVTKPYGLAGGIPDKVGDRINYAGKLVAEKYKGSSKWIKGMSSYINIER